MTKLIKKELDWQVKWFLNKQCVIHLIKFKHFFWGIKK